MEKGKKHKPETIEKLKEVSGRPTLYKEEYNDLAYKLSLLGHTDIELARFFEVCEKTLNLWKIEYPLFLQSIKEGKDVADAKVVQALYKAAIGYTVDDVKIFQNQGQELIVPYKRVVDGDVTAQKKWLSARQRKIWSESLSLTGGTDENGNDKPLQIIEVRTYINEPNDKADISD
jgi:hypothetical protein